jgi:hypothetical protein
VTPSADSNRALKSERAQFSCAREDRLASMNALDDGC